MSDSDSSVDEEVLKALKESESNFAKNLYSTNNLNNCGMYYNLCPITVNLFSVNFSIKLYKVDSPGRSRFCQNSRTS